jgi:hypothetical protein
MDSYDKSSFLGQLASAQNSILVWDNALEAHGSFVGRWNFQTHKRIRKITNYSFRFAYVCVGKQLLSVFIGQLELSLQKSPHF